MIRLPVLHISVPVKDLEHAVEYYRDVLGCATGRQRVNFADVWFFGCQLTLVRQGSGPSESSTGYGRHFGVILDAHDFQELASAVTSDPRSTVLSPTTRAGVGTPAEQAKLMIEDPDGNRIELKTYANPQAALAVPRRA